MMSSQHQMCLQKLPQKKIEYNSKDRLYNSLLDFLHESLPFQRMKWITLGSILYACYRSVWYIDGRHAIIEHHSAPIPTTFSRFVGFNVPQKSKHRKCVLEICSIFYPRYKNPCLECCKQNFGKDRNGRTFMMLPLLPQV